MSTVLDNPVYYSLCDVHQNFALDFNQLKVYPPDVLPFGGFRDLTGDVNSLTELSKIADHFMIIGNIEPKLPTHLKIKKEISCYQMVSSGIIETTNDEQIILLNHAFENELYDLVTTFYNGFFRKKTIELGNYYGIFREEKLVAVTGERLQTHTFSEISAVVTHTDYTKLGLASTLVSFVNNDIIHRGKTPFLHVDIHNTSAINLYKKLGFTVRTTIKVWFIGIKN